MCVTYAKESAVPTVGAFSANIPIERDCENATPRGLLASSKRSPTNEPSRVGKEKEAIWGGSKVPGSTYSTPSMPLVL